MKICLFLLSLFSFSMVRAQVFGGTPPEVKWNQVNNDSFRVIFPSGLDSQAQRVASIVNLLASLKPVSLGDKLKKINIVLQNQTTIPNGYVGLGPFRSEFFLNPVMNNFQEGSISWTDQLALHEYRHVQQFNNFRNGLSNLMYYLFGEEGLALAINAAIPDWFYEGDAVYNETVLSSQGRGRLPAFMNAFPAIWSAGKNYSWMKLRNGSLKDFVPNHYYLGYLLVNYGRIKYGDDFWAKVTRDASAYKGLVYPFQAAVKKYSGIDYKTFREEAFDYYKNEFKVNTGDETKSAYVIDDYFPYFVSPDTLLFLRSSYRHRPAFYYRTGTGDHKVRVRDISIDEQFSYRNGKIVYSAYETDPRWGWRDYSVIRLLDLSTGKQHTLTRKSKYFTPDISPGGSKIAAVEFLPSGKSSLHILDAGTGNIMAEIKSSDIRLYTDPKFIDENNLVTAVRLNDGKMALALVDVLAGSTTRLTLPSYHVVGYPSVQNDTVYFTGSYEGNNNLYAVRISDRKLFKLTGGGFGDYFVNSSGDKLVWSGFTAEGHQLKQALKSQLMWQEITVQTGNTDTTTDILNKIPGETFPVTGYKKSTGLFRVHSWRPYYSDPIFTYSVYTENILNTLQSELYYLYNENERTHAAGFGLVYGGWFPNIHLGSEYTFDRTSVENNRIRHWDQVDTRLGVSFPLDFTKGRFLRSFNGGSFYTLRNELNKGFFKDSLGNDRFSYLFHFISWNQQVQRAAQHIYPRLGYGAILNHRHAIGGNDGYQFSGSGTIYLPGILNVHNLVLTGSWQQRDTLNATPLFSDRFGYSRGYVGRYFSRMWRLSANYHFPLFYPDWGFGNILYLQRIRANFFYDFTTVYSRDKKTTAGQRSVGGELFVETKWWNQYPLTFGIRVSRLLDPDQFDGWKGTVFELVVPTSIIPK